MERFYGNLFLLLQEAALITLAGLTSQDPGSSPDSAANYLCDSGQVTLSP